MRKLVLAALLALAPVAARASGYYVYCANSKIEVDSRDFGQMKSARGSGICQLGSFGYLSDAQSFAKKNFGGVGGKCSCR
ncbi:MAG: hypothetical protein AB7O88_20245 [Reyranellaceae bacterium]